MSDDIFVHESHLSNLVVDEGLYILQIHIFCLIFEINWINWTFNKICHHIICSKCKSILIYLINDSYIVM